MLSKQLKTRKNMYISKPTTGAGLIKLLPEGFLDRTEGKRNHGSVPGSSSVAT